MQQKLWRETGPLALGGGGEKAGGGLTEEGTFDDTRWIELHMPENADWHGCRQAPVTLGIWAGMKGQLRNHGGTSKTCLQFIM